MLGGQVRVTVLVRGEAGSTLHVDDLTFKLKGGEEQISFLRDGREAQVFAVSASRGVRLVALTVLPAQAEIPAPPPEAWHPETPAEAAP